MDKKELDKLYKYDAERLIEAEGRHEDECRAREINDLHQEFLKQHQQNWVDEIYPWDI